MLKQLWMPWNTITRERKPRLGNYSTFETSRSLSHHMRKLFVSWAQHPLHSPNLQLWPELKGPWACQHKYQWESKPSCWLRIVVTFYSPVSAMTWKSVLPWAYFYGKIMHHLMCECIVKVPNSPTRWLESPVSPWQNLNLFWQEHGVPRRKEYKYFHQCSEIVPPLVLWKQRCESII